jgi:hypothetical protein
LWSAIRVCWIPHHMRPCAAPVLRVPEHFLCFRIADANSSSLFSTAEPMATATESLQRNHLAVGPEESMGARTVPIVTPTIHMSAPSPGEPMELTTSTSSSAPASATKSPESDANGVNDRPRPRSQNDHADNIIMPAPVAAAAAVHQPKIVQTAFIHKLYKCASLIGPCSPYYRCCC